MPPSQSNADTALKLAMNTDGDFVGVVLLSGDTGGWHAFPMISRAALDEWYGDWFHGGDHAYLASFDKTQPSWNDGSPIVSVGAPMPVDSARVQVNQVGDVHDASARRDVLKRLHEAIQVHEDQWSEFAAHHASDRNVYRFFLDLWDPFYRQWTALEPRLTADDIDDMRKILIDLANIRLRAPNYTMPVPDIGDLMPKVSVSGGRGGFHGGGGYHGAGGDYGYHGGGGGYHEPVRGRGGWYRPGSAYPGRWWNGENGPTWVESDVNLMLEDQDSPHDDMPPPGTDTHPISDDAKGAPPADRDPATADPASADAAAVTASGAVLGRACVTKAPRGSRLIDVAPILNPNLRPVDLAFDLAEDGFLNVTAKYKDQTYTARTDLAPLWAVLAPKVDAYYAELQARPTMLMGAWPHEGHNGYLPLSSRTGVNRPGPLRPLNGETWAARISRGRHHHGEFSAALVGAGVSVSGGCGSRTYANVTPDVMRAMFAGLKERGADVTGNNPWYCVTHDHGVEFRGSWDQAKQQLVIEVTDSDFAAPCAAIWSTVESMLVDHGATRVSSADAGLSDVLGEADQAIRAAGQVLVGAAMDKAGALYCAGWFDSITNAIGSAAKGVANGVASAAGTVANTVGHTLVKLKGPIAAAAGTAAAAGAMAIPGVGPMVAPMAGSLATSLVNAAAGGDDQAQAAAATVASASQAAQTDPTVAKALDLAHKAAAQSTAAYHVTQTAANAAAGSPDAITQLTDLANAASKGDASAQNALDIAFAASNIAGNNAANGGAPDASAVAAAGWFAPAFAGLFGLSAGYFGPDVYHWAKAKWDKHKADTAKTKVSGDIADASLSDYRAAASEAVWNQLSAEGSNHPPYYLYVMSKSGSGTVDGLDFPNEAAARRFTRGLGPIKDGAYVALLALDALAPKILEDKLLAAQ